MNSLLFLKRIKEKNTCLDYFSGSLPFLVCVVHFNNHKELLKAIESAEKPMYEAKQDKKECFKFYDDLNR